MWRPSSKRQMSVIAEAPANNESSEVFDIIKPGRRVKIKDHRQ